MTHIAVDCCTVVLEGELAGFTARMSKASEGPNVELVTLHLASEVALASPTDLTLIWKYSSAGVLSSWYPSADWRRGNDVDWGGERITRGMYFAPVYCLHGGDGTNKLTFALSDALNAAGFKVGIQEETGDFACRIRLLAEPGPARAEYTVVLRLDTRPIPYSAALADVSRWWETLPGYEPSFVPETARRPMYSTWYTFHQHLTPEGIEQQAALGKPLGCDAIIVDDGWQTADGARGYAFCGDWKVAPERIPDMRAHVARVHALGVKYLLWYSVPFVGSLSAAWARFEGKFLRSYSESSTDTTRHVGILDPRFPEVREYLCATYEAALRDWDLDGFKLDFVDMFSASEEAAAITGGDRDFDSIPEATDRLLTDVMLRLRAQKPDILIEFRQAYIGPMMRKYGNMFRAGDCPVDPLFNRLRTLDIRLLSGNTAAHADMVMWHPGESPEMVALHLWNTLFAVPQISVRLDTIPVSHQEVVAWYLSFWRTHRDALLDGLLSPLHPESQYPMVLAENASKQVVALYSPLCVSLPGSTETYIVNATPESRVFVEASSPAEYEVTVRDCRGALVSQERTALAAGLHALVVPPSGVVALVRR